jgi:hypothetical protein
MDGEALSLSWSLVRFRGLTEIHHRTGPLAHVHARAYFGHQYLPLLTCRIAPNSCAGPSAGAAPSPGHSHSHTSPVLPAEASEASGLVNWWPDRSSMWLSGPAALLQAKSCPGWLRWTQHLPQITARQSEWLVGGFNRHVLYFQAVVRLGLHLSEDGCAAARVIMGGC